MCLPRMKSRLRPRRPSRVGQFSHSQLSNCALCSDFFFKSITDLQTDGEVAVRRGALRDVDDRLWILHRAHVSFHVPDDRLNLRSTKPAFPATSLSKLATLSSPITHLTTENRNLEEAWKK